MIEINYDDLVRNYWDGLTSTLRGFKGGEEFLDLWVPDEDIIKSLINLIEAAQDSNQDEFVLFLQRDTIDKVDLEFFINSLSSLGKVEIGEDKDTYKFYISSLIEYSSFKDVNPIYLEAIRSSYQNQSHNKSITQVNEYHEVEISLDSLSFTIQVDQKTHLIKDAAFKGAKNPLEAGLLNSLCNAIINLTVLEASDHGILYLEESLRNSNNLKRDVGIIIPESIDPMFNNPIIIVRKLLAAYKETTGYILKVNTFVSSISKNWKRLEENSKLEKINEIVTVYSSENNADKRYLKVVSIEEGVRVIFEEFSKEDEIYEQGKHLIQFEYYLKKRIKEPFELYLEEREDSNLKRKRV
jgi:hypothetical protein